jgi:hypothetical protein
MDPMMPNFDNVPEEVKQGAKEMYANYVQTYANYMKIPEEIRQFFETGSVLVERFGMPRFEVRHRVVDVLAVWGDEEEPQDIHIVDSSIREFRTAKGAEIHRDRLVNAGRRALMQHAILVWLTEDEWPK